LGLCNQGFAGAKERVGLGEPSGGEVLRHRSDGSR
jgi:hypothetical protein